MGRLYCKHTLIVCNSSGQALNLTVYLNTNMENKPYPRTKESMKNLLKAKLECKGCIGNCIPSRGGALSAEDANSTALLQTKQELE